MAEPDASNAPRKLRLTFEFEMPPGTKVNVRTKARMAAVSALTAAVEALAKRELPWATSMTVRHEWMYAWHDKTTTVKLAAESEISE